MKKLLSIALCICLTLAAVFVVAPTTKVDADTADAHALLSAYYNNGTYTKETHIFAGESQAFSSVNADDNFHAKASQLARTTVYTPGRLYMTTDNSNGGYKDVGSDMVRFHLDGGVEEDDFTVKNTSVQEYFTDLFELATVGTWEFVDGVYTNTNAVWQWVHFIAPMWDPKTEVVTFTKVEMSTESVEGVNRLVLDLFGETATVDETLFAKAIITPGVDAVKTQITTIANYATANSWVNGTKYNTLATDVVTVTATGGGNTGKYYTSDLTWRIYKNETPTITITGTPQCNVVGVAVTYNINKGATLALNGTTIESDKFVPVSNNTITFGVNGTEGNIGITAITVYYTGGCDHTNTTTTTVDATCTEAGSTTITCDDCKAIISEEEIPATGHNFVDGVCANGCGATQETTKIWQKATSIAVDDVITLVYDNSTALSGISNTSTKYGLGEATIQDGIDDGAMKLTVVAGSTAGTYAFKTEDGKYLTWTSGNSLNVSATSSANTSWTVTFEEGNAIILNAADATRKLQWNTGSPRFACYTSAQAAIQIYKYAVVCEHANTTTTTVDATCGKAGFVKVTCVDCNAIISEEEIPATGAHTEVSVPAVEATCTETGLTEGKKCSVCETVIIAQVETEALGHTTEEGTCERCGETIGTDAPAEPVTITKTMTAQIKGDVVLDDVITFNVSGGANSGNFYTDHIRVYSSDSPAGSVTITAAEGYIIKSITFNFTTSTYAILQYNGNYISSGTAITIDADTATFNAVTKGSTKQARIKSVTIVYEKA